MTAPREEGPASQPEGGEPGPLAPDTDDNTRSLVDDIEDLVFDAKTYFDAELSYQKTRASFVGACVKRMLGLGVAALVLALFAFGGLVIGLIIALTPHLTAWGATAVVVGALLLIVVLLLWMAGKAWKDMMEAVNEGREPPAEAEETVPEQGEPGQ